jgi:hypothetical protein
LQIIKSSQNPAYRSAALTGIRFSGPCFYCKTKDKSKKIILLLCQLADTEDEESKKALIRNVVPIKALSL